MALVLLDEMEKAHTDEFNTLLQVMEEARLTVVDLKEIIDLELTKRPRTTTERSNT